MEEKSALADSLPTLWLVIPCYNEEDVLPITAPMFKETVASLISDGLVAKGSRILFINDGSSDKTWKIIQELAREPIFEGVSLSRNRGHQNALLAGLMECRSKCDISVSIDCDGQDDISKIRDMVLKFNDGFDVVYGVRSSRDTDTAFKRFTAEGFYKVLNLMGVEAVFNHADYRLMSARALDGLAQFNEVNLFLRGMVPLVGYPSSTVEYSREERIAGESHYPLSKMIHLAFDGITSLSVKPIHLIAAIGIMFSLVGLVGVVWAVVSASMGATVAGWSSLVCIICLLGGLQLLALGVIGEYIGKLYLESKHRPRFIVADRTWKE